MKVFFITSNASKIKLANERLSRYEIEVKQYSLDLYEIQSLNINEVTKNKAKQVLEFISKPFIIEDSAMFIKALHNFPGALLKPVLESLSDEHLLRILKKGEDRSVTVASQLIFSDGNKNGIFKMFEGFYDGSLADKPRGENLRGWRVSRIFIPKNSKKTLAEMNDQEWQDFLNKFRKNDHYEKFGKWIVSQGKNFLC